MADACSLHCSLKFRDGKKWKQRSCVLKKLSPVADCLHLSLRKEGEGFGRTSLVGSLRANSSASSDEANLPLDDYFGVDTGFELDREKHVMAIICRRRVFTLAFHNQETLNSWKTFVCSQLGDGKCFQVSMVKATGAQLRSHLGPVNLYVRGRTLCIATRGQLAGPPIYLASWTVSRLRRFGVQSGLFCFDAGDPAEFAGVFAFASPVATDIDSELKQSAVLQLTDRQGSCSDVKRSATDQRLPGSQDSATTPNFTPPANESQQMYHNFPVLTDGIPGGRSAATVPPSVDSASAGIPPPPSSDMMYYNIPPAGGHNTDSKTPCDSPIVARTRSPGGASQPPALIVYKSSSQSLATPGNPAMERAESLGNSEFIGSASAAATQQLKRGLSADDRRNNRFHLRRHSLGDIYRKIQAAMSDGLSLPRGLGWTSSSNKLSATTSDVDAGLTLDSVPNAGRGDSRLSTPKFSLDRGHTSVHNDSRDKLSTGSVTSRSPAKMVPCNAPPTPPPRCNIRTKRNVPVGRTTSNCEEGYIDIRPFTSRRRTRAHGDAAESFCSDFTPLTHLNSTALTGRRVVEPPAVLDSDIDSAFRPVSDPDLTDENSSLLPKDGEFRPRSFSIGSQLSAAATSVHEESCPDLVAAVDSVETGFPHVAKDKEPVAMAPIVRDFKYTEADYMPMVGHSPANKSTGPPHHSSHSTVVKSPSFGVISTSSRPLAANRPKSACPLPTRHSDAGLLSLPPTRENLVDNDDSGYLMFNCGGGIVSSLPACGDQSAESSLEKLGPPPAVPHSANGASADTEYMNLANCSSMSDCPPLPPKMSSAGGMEGTRKKAMLSLVAEEEPVPCRGKRMEKVTADAGEIAMGSGVVQQRSPVVPPRQDLTAQQQRSSVISRRPAARCGKPDLTVDIINSPPSSGPVTRQFSAVHPASAPRLLADLNTRHSLPPTPASAFSLLPRGNNDSANTSSSSQRSTSQAITTLRPRNGCEYLRINRRRLASASLGDGSPLPSATPRSPSSKSLTVFNFDTLVRSQGVAGGESPRRSHSSRHRPPPPPIDASTPNQPQTIALDEVLAPPLPPSPKVNYTDLDLADVPSSSPPVASRSVRGVCVAPALDSVTEYAQIDFEATSAAAQAGRAHVQSREVCLERRDVRPTVSRAGSIVAATAP